MHDAGTATRRTRGWRGRATLTTSALACRTRRRRCRGAGRRPPVAIRAQRDALAGTVFETARHDSFAAQHDRLRAR